MIAVRLFFPATRIIILLCIFSCSSSSFASVTPNEGGDGGLPPRAWGGLNALLQRDKETRCSVAVVADVRSAWPALTQMGGVGGAASGGWSLFEAGTTCSDDNTTKTTADLTTVVKRVRQVRRRSWCLTVIVLVTASCPRLLAPLAEACVQARLLAGETRLLLVTRVAPTLLSPLVDRHWAFTMGNTLIMNIRDTASRVSMYLYRPYDRKGPQLAKVAEWPEGPGTNSTFPSSFLHLQRRLRLLQDKFSNFHGAKVPVTAKPFPPYWLEGDGEDHTAGHGEENRNGTDYLLLDAVASARNFTIRVVPTADWDEVTQKVEQREAFMATVIYAVLPERLKRYDFSYPYEYASPTFCMTKPVLRPQFLSLYYPLADEVWLSILLALILVPVILLKVIDILDDSSTHTRISSLMGEVLRTLLGQDISRAGRRLVAARARLVIGAWLLFALVIGSAYRGNLTASLTIPKYPPRPETLLQLVQVVEKVTMPPYGAQFRDFYSQSDSKVFKTLAQRMDLVSTAEEGLSQASDKQAHIQVRRYLELVIAESFTLRDGSTKLYLGRENVFPGLSAWPIPHDAPYKTKLDGSIMAVKEAGLYEKWSKDVMAEARKRGKEKREEEGDEEEEEEKGKGASSIQALSLTHLQGPLFVLLMGLLFAGVLFIGEWAALRLVRLGRIENGKVSSSGRYSVGDKFVTLRR